MGNGQKQGTDPGFFIHHRGTEDKEKREGERERLATDARGRALTIRMEGVGKRNFTTETRR